MYFQRRSHSRIALVVLVLTTGLLSASAVEATLINGRVSLVSYTWKPVSSPVNPEPETDMDMISRLSFNARRIGGSAWSIYFHGGLRGEVLNAPLKDLDGVVYRTRLEFAPSAHLNAGLGRMWVTSGGIGSKLKTASRQLIRIPQPQISMNALGVQWKTWKPRESTRASSWTA